MDHLSNKQLEDYFAIDQVNWKQVSKSIGKKHFNKEIDSRKSKDGQRFTAKNCI